MKQKLSIFTTSVLVAILLIFVPSNSADVSANSVGVTILEAGSDSASIADGYFSSSATYTVENGKNYVQMTITDAQFVKSLSGPYGAAQVISDSGDTRVVKLQVGDMNQPVTLSMHVVVPEEIAQMEYDNHHTARAVFSGVPDLSSDTNNSEEPTTAGTVENPPTGDSTPIATYMVLIVAAVGVFALYRFRVARNE